LNPPDSLRYRAWGLSWIAYVTYYTGRKGFSVVKKSVHDQLGVSVEALGVIDTVYLAAYSMGQFVSGFWGDRIGARKLLSFGLLGSAVCCVAFGASSAALLFGLFFCLNGFAQSTGWPGTTRVMAEWTTRKNRGRVMAFWATCYMVGGIVANSLAGELLGAFGWRAAFFGPALLILLVALALFFFLPRGSDDESEAVVQKDDQVPLDVRRKAQRAVIRNPALWCYGASYFFVKFIRYTLLFWLPFYLAKELGYDERIAAHLSNAFEVGGIAGVIVIGILSDRMRRFSRSALALLWLLGLAVALLAYGQLAHQGTLTNIVLLALVGAALFGPDSLVSGAIAQDAGDGHAASMATGFVNGVGSVGAMLQGLLVPVITSRWGWQALFPTFVVLSFLAAVALLPTVRRARVQQSTIEP
jgi:sugar phosphate permease